MRRLIAILLCTWFAWLPGAAAAAFERTVFQYTHQRWSEESDAPRPVIALAQDRSGYLWAATAGGVFRFDGIRFERISTGVDLVVHGPPSALLVRRNGDVWVNFERSKRFAVYRGGQFRFLDAPPATHRVIAMHEARDGTIWVLTERVGIPLLRYRDGRWTSFGAEAGAPNDNPFSMVVTRDGSVWISFSSSVMRLMPGASRFEPVRETPRALGRLALDPQERIWLSERRGTYPITGPGGRGSPPPLRHPYATDAGEIRGWPSFDREGNLWIATYYDGLQRIAHPDPRGAATAAEALAWVEHFTARDGLSADVTNQVFQDAEGNVWVATRNGLDRFWPATLHFEPELTDTAAFGDMLLRAADGSVYIAQASTVYRVRPGGRPEAIFRAPYEPRTLCEAPDGAIWIGTDDRQVFVWRDGRARALGQKVPVTETIYDCAFDARGDYWVTASRGGMARFSGGRWQRMFGDPGDAFLPKSMVADARGHLFVHWNDRLLSRLDGTTRSSVAIPFGSYQPYDVALYPAAPDTLLVAGRFGLARLRGAEFRSISAQQMPLFSDVNGMVQTADGQTWLAGPAGILRVATAQLEQAFANPGQALAVQVLGRADGLRSPPHDHSRHSIVQGGDGRLWIATQTGTLWLDPADVTRSRMPPQVSVGALIADKPYRDPTSIKLPAGTSNIEIDFAVLSFSNPRSARVRYRIEEQDPQWIEAGTRRQAFYTNLAPGTYHFRLIAANNDGIWNQQGTTVTFEIPPTFTQSRWFALLCALLALALAWAVMRWRYAQATRRLRARLEERIHERERIARDLHDTLLQGVQGLVLHFQAFADRLPRADSQRAALQTALDQADGVILEGRERVRALRSHDEATDLERVLRELVAACPFDPSVKVEVEVEGRPRPVHPWVVSEISLIAGEALFNTARHAHAGRVEIVLGYDHQRLRVRFRDDGVGIPPRYLGKDGREGHFGLVGMRERTERIGGLFSIRSEEGAGTEVVMILAAKLAYLDDHPSGLLQRLGRLFGYEPRDRGD